MVIHSYIMKHNSRYKVGLPPTSHIAPLHPTHSPPKRPVLVLFHFPFSFPFYSFSTLSSADGPHARDRVSALSHPPFPTWSNSLAAVCDHRSLQCRNPARNLHLVSTVCVFITAVPNTKSVRVGGGE